MLRMVPLPRFAGEDHAKLFTLSHFSYYVLISFSLTREPAKESSAYPSGTFHRSFS